VREAEAKAYDAAEVNAMTPQQKALKAAAEAAGATTASPLASAFGAGRHAPPAGSDIPASTPASAAAPAVGVTLGEAVHVERMKSKLKAPGIKC
jgi:hypothetical protein